MMQSRPCLSLREKVGVGWKRALRLLGFVHVYHSSLKCTEMWENLTNKSWKNVGNKG